MAAGIGINADYSSLGVFCLVGCFLVLFTLKTIVQSSVFTLEEEQTSVLFDVCTS